MGTKEVCSPMNKPRGGKPPGKPLPSKPLPKSPGACSSPSNGRK